MSARVLVLLCACVISVLSKTDYSKLKPYYSLDDEALCLQLFEQFIIDYNRNYSGQDEKDMRYEIFKQNLQDINRKNALNPHALFDISKFSDVTDDEYIPRKTNFSISNIPDLQMYEASLPDLNVTEPFPESFDWRDKGVVGKVKNQQNCQASFAFAVTGALEAAHAQKHKVLYSLSEQQLLECPLNGCEELSLYMALFLPQQGNMREEDYPFTSGQSGRVGKCKRNTDKTVVFPNLSKMYHLYMYTERLFQVFLTVETPMGVAIAGDCIKNYKSGVVTQCAEDISIPHLNHNVLLVGYGKDVNGSFWIMKNSFGEDFGEKGYLRCRIGNNVLGFMNFMGTSFGVH